MPLNTYLIAAREKFQILKMARTIKELCHPFYIYLFLSVLMQVDYHSTHAVNTDYKIK